MSSTDQKLFEYKTICNILFARIQRLERKVSILECSNTNSNKNYIKKIDEIEKNLELLKIKVNNNTKNEKLFTNTENELNNLLNFSFDITDLKKI